MIKMRWQDSSLPVEDRIQDLIGRLTLEEKISQLITNGREVIENRDIERLGLKGFKLGGECLHGLCLSGRATQFPMPIGMAAMFDAPLLEKIASVIADEARARHHDPRWRQADGKPLVGLMFYTPVVNIARDPRWGRTQETYGEDPYLTSVLGSAFVRGLQGNHPKYLKVAACAKHLAVASGPEELRCSFNAVVSRKDLVETYLPAFEVLVRQGVAMVMATYNRVNGEHCCASPTLLDEFLRGRWGFDGLVMSDGGALGTVHNGHKITADAVETAGLCLRNGCDQEIGLHAYPLVAKAIERGLLTEADIDRALRRIFKVRFQVGEFDPPDQVPYTQIKPEVVQSRKHIQLAREAARKSMVLLKNNGILPLRSDKKVVFVTGPCATDVQVLLGNFYRGVSGDLRTILEGIVQTAPEGVMINHLQGCLLTHPNIYSSNWAAGQMDWSDVAVVALGYSPLMEGEQGECIAAPKGGDRASIDLPAHQIEFLRELKSQGKPIVAVVTGGAPINLGEVHDLADAVLMAWYPGEQGGMAVGDLLFGKVSPSGKLPVTFPKSLADLPEFVDYNMAGRTYRYMTKEPLYPFGFGLSYTKFEYHNLAISKSRIAKVTVQNTGTVTADEVVQLYITDDQASVPVPRWALKDFRRITLAAGESREVKFKITPAMLELVNASGERVLEPGSFTVTIGGACPDPRSEILGAPTPVRATLNVR